MLANHQSTTRVKGHDCRNSFSLLSNQATLDKIGQATTKNENLTFILYKNSRPSLLLLFNSINVRASFLRASADSTSFFRIPVSLFGLFEANLLSRHQPKN
jgi:hypothetical protein